MIDHRAQIEHNLAAIRQRIHDAARRAGRDPDSVTLIAVTKYVSAELTRAVVLAGCRDLGESRPQDLWQKSAALTDLDVRWHLVGHLQRNKVRRTLPCIHLLHSADSRRLIGELQKEAQALGISCPTLLEVNVSGDANKHGWKAFELEELLPALPEYPNVQVRGLMTMAALDHQGEAARADFRALAQLRERLQESVPPGVQLHELSMGMSGDFEAAVEEGATLVRIGSALFDGIPDSE